MHPTGHLQNGKLFGVNNMIRQGIKMFAESPVLPDDVYFILIRSQFTTGHGVFKMPGEMLTGFSKINPEDLLKTFRILAPFIRQIEKPDQLDEIANGDNTR